MENVPQTEAETELELLYVLMQPTRRKIIRALKTARKPLYIKEIADQIEENERNVSFHLSTLAEYGFVDGEYREIEAPTHHSAAVKGKAAKFYRLTKKVENVTERLASQI